MKSNKVKPLEAAIQSSLQAWGNLRYRQGLEEGIQAIEKIRGWLTRQPDRKWQKEIRGWVDKLLKQFEDGKVSSK